MQFLGFFPGDLELLTQGPCLHDQYWQLSMKELKNIKRSTVTILKTLHAGFAQANKHGKLGCEFGSF